MGEAEKLPRPANLAASGRARPTRSHGLSEFNLGCARKARLRLVEIAFVGSATSRSQLGRPPSGAQSKLLMDCYGSMAELRGRRKRSSRRQPGRGIVQIR